MLHPITHLPSTSEQVATVTRKGQITIPARVRQHLNIQMTRQLAFVVDPNGDVRLKVPKYPTLASIMGAITPLAHSLTMQEIRDRIDQDRAEAYTAKAQRTDFVSPEATHP